VFDGLSLAKEFISSLLHGGDGELIIHVNSLDDFEFTVLRGNWIGEDESFWDTILRSIGQKTSGLPLAASFNPVSHVINGS